MATAYFGRPNGGTIRAEAREYGIDCDADAMRTDPTKKEFKVNGLVGPGVGA
jgi:hypothetical protein